MNIKILVSLVLMNAAAFAVSTNEVNQNLSSLVSKINQVNYDLAKKHSQKKNLDGAISDSNEAIKESSKLLGQLKEERSVSASQLNEINRTLPQIRQATQDVQDNVKLAIAHIYQQIKILQNNSDSVLAVNDTLQTKRKTQYLINILQVEQAKYQSLQTKLNELYIANDKLAVEVARIDKELGDKAKEQEKLQALKQQKIHQAQELSAEIKDEQEQLSGLTQKQAELNRLLAALASTENETKKASKTNQANSGAGIVHTKPDTSDENNSPFFNRTLAKPLNAKISVAYGAKRHGVRNNGVLYNSTNAPVYSISDGMVMYSGDLPGFGQVIVINHGDNYMSIYGGVLPQGVSRGQRVRMGQIIANSGSAKNQAMGGVYFELRHYGKPVNPSDLVN